MRTLIIDNYDSFTFNWFQLLAEISGEEPLVIRNDQLSWDELTRLEFDNIVISAGPGSAERETDFGICCKVLREATVPVLGVCLGHQGLSLAYGGRVVPAPEVMHGRLSAIFHSGAGLFAGVPQGFQAVRYHSLVVSDELPGCLEKIAWTEAGIIMGLRHRELPLWGVQFHPESICTEYGRRLVENFHQISHTFYQRDNHQRSPSQRASGARRSVVPRGKEHPASKTSTRYAVRSRKLETLYDSEQVYCQLFGQERGAPWASPWASLQATFWLDSSRVKEGLSRFSYIGSRTGPLGRVIEYETASRCLTIIQNGVSETRRESIFDYVERETARLGCDSPHLPFDFNCGFVGYFGYELKAECGSQLVHRSPLPDAALIFADRLIAFDHQEKVTYLVHLVVEGDESEANAWFEEMERQLKALPYLPSLVTPTDVASPPIQFRLARPYETYLADIRECQRLLAAGESYEICLTNTISTDQRLDPLTLYRHLRRINPAPYAAFLRFGELAILSSSPERFLRVDSEGGVEAKPIKGTVPRGQTLHEDMTLRYQLQRSDKNRAENLMIVDLLRNDLGLVCEVGSVQVPKLMQVESYATVHQLVSTIRGKLRRGLSVMDCFRATFPGGSMTGAPKLRTMRIIDELEGTARGVYSGAIGFLGLNGAADFGMVIRTIVSSASSLSLGVGGAITIQSDPEEEFDEMLLKAQALLRAIVVAGGGEFDGGYEIAGTRGSQGVQYSVSLAAAGAVTSSVRDEDERLHAVPIAAEVP